MDSLVGDSVHSEVAKLNALPETLPGVQQLVIWKTGFDATFGSLRTIPAVNTATAEYNQARTRIYGGARPSWQQQVEAIPADGVAITAKRHELETLFPDRDSRT